MSRSRLFWVGIGFGIIGILIVLKTNSTVGSKIIAIPEGYCEVTYPSDWHTEIRKSVTIDSQSGGPPEIRSYNPDDSLPPNTTLFITADLLNPGKTTRIRLVFIEFDPPFDLMFLAKFQSTINSEQPDYKLIELKEIAINSYSAVRRIESYRVDTNRGPQNYSLVATYFKTNNGMCSVLLVDALWSEMQTQMKVYEEIVGTFRIDE